MSHVAVNNLVVVSDPHFGCQLGLCPPDIAWMDEGGMYQPSEEQCKVWGYWQEFWGDWVPMACHHEPFAVCVNGDSIDGRHHGSVSQFTHNLAAQGKLAERVLRPVVDQCEGRFYMTRGTEAHVGPSAEEEEALATSLGAIPDAAGRHARYELWVRVGKGLCHIMHHIGTTGSAQYESSGPMSELAAEYAEAGRWNNEAPNVVVRSHRHRHIEVRVPTALGYGIVFVTAGWQLKTPFVYRTAGGRVQTPQFGGSLIRQGDEDLYTRHRIWSIGRPQEVRL